MTPHEPGPGTGSTPDRASRRRYLRAVGGAAGGFGLVGPSGVRGRADPAGATVPADATVPDDAVADAVDRLRSFLRRSPRFEGDHWESEPSAGIWDVRYTIYHALMLERLDARPANERRAIDYVLSKRGPDGGWGDAEANFAGRLLLREVDAAAYAGELDAIDAEIAREDMSLDEEGFDGAPLRLQVVLTFHVLMTDEYAAEDLFSEERARIFEEVLRSTPAFEGEFDPTEPFVNPAQIDFTLSLGLLAAAIRDADDDADELSELLLRRRVPNGAWRSTLTNVFAVLALAEATDVDASDPEVAHAVEFLCEERQTAEGRVVGFKLSISENGWLLDALRASGLDPQGETMRRTAQWLYDNRVAHPMRTRRDETLDRLPVPFREEFGLGWGYRPSGHADWDDTGIGLAALSPYDDRPLEDIVEFALDVQNDDGSWSTYGTDVDYVDDDARRAFVDEFGRETYELLFTNPPAPDVMGHVMLGVGSNGRTVGNEPALRDAVAFLEDARDDNDLWRGLWGIRYTYGTSRVLAGLRAVGVEPDREPFGAAADALVDRQNDDGGWGEGREHLRLEDVSEPATYVPEPSRTTQTAWALQALLAAEVPPDAPAVRRGVRYLLDRQRPDGSWPAERVMLLYDLAYRTPVFTHASVLKALSAYADAGGVDVAPTDDPRRSPLRDLVGPLGTLTAIGGVAALRRRVGSLLGR